MIHFKLHWNETAIITDCNCVAKIGKYRLYKVTFLRKKAYLIADTTIRRKYKKLGRITNHLFIASRKREVTV